MRRGTIIVIVFVIAAGVIVGVSQFLQRQPPVEFTVAINPLAEDWLRDSINRFNDTQPVVNATQRIEFNISVLDDLNIWQGSSTYTADDHPAAWIPASIVSVDYAERYETLLPSLARTPLVWGGYSSRVDVAANSADGEFDWPAVQNAAVTESWAALDGGDSRWRFVNLALTPPDMTMSGLGALFTAAADFQDSPDLSGNTVNESAFRDWLAPVVAAVPNFQTLGSDPAAAVARGPGTASMALLPEKLWLLNLGGLTSDPDENFTFHYPAYQFMLDFPLAAWSDRTQVSDIEQLAVEALGNWLSAEAQQGRLAANGLRPAASEPTETDNLFSAAVPYGILLEPDYGVTVQPPERNTANGLSLWFRQQR